MNHFFNTADFITKHAPTLDMSWLDTHTSLTNAGKFVDDNVVELNALNRDILDGLDQAASSVYTINNDVAQITNRIANIYTLTGESRDSLSVFDDGVAYETDGIVLDRNLMQIRLDKTPLMTHSIEDVRIVATSGEPGNTSGPIKKSFSIDNILDKVFWYEHESYTEGITMDIFVDLGALKPINTLSFVLQNFGTRMPDINSISHSVNAVHYDNVILTASGTISMNPSDFGMDSGAMRLSFKEAYSRYIKISLSQGQSHGVLDTKKRYAIGINNLSATFHSAKKSGSIIIGPLKNPSPILKASIYSKIDRYNIEDKNVRVALSHDKQTWISVQNALEYDRESETDKVINYNNIDPKSYNTPEAVKSLYVRVNMDAIDVSEIYGGEPFIRRDVLMLSKSNPTGYLSSDANEKSFTLFKAKGIKYGSQVVIQDTSLDGLDIPPASIAEATIDGKYQLKSIGIDNAPLDLGRAAIGKLPEDMLSQFMPDKVHVSRDDGIENKPSYQYDPYDIKLSGLTSVLRTNINMESVMDSVMIAGMLPVLQSTLDQGIYTIHSGTYRGTINLSSGLFMGNMEALIELPTADEAMIYNEIGELVGKIMPIEIGGRHIATLGEHFAEPEMGILDRVYSHTYPIVPLKNNEYAFMYGKIIFGSYYRGTATIGRVNKYGIGATATERTEGRKLLSETSRQLISEYPLSDKDFQTVIKLQHVNIIEQSVKFDSTLASIRSFTKEVPFVDGVTEFLITSVKTDALEKNASIIWLDKNFIDDNYLYSDGNTDLLVNRVYSTLEMVYLGDYFITEHMNSDNEMQPAILLPAGVATDAVAETRIRYNVEPSKQSSAGLYSINYRRGILHSVTPIDGQTSITYISSSMYAEYEAMDIIDPKRYSKGEQSIYVDTSDVMPARYLAISSGRLPALQGYMETPVMNEFKLNIIDMSNSI